MCKSSQEARFSVRAQPGVQYAVTKTSGGLAGLSLQGASTRDCIACFHTGEKITLANIHPALSAELGVGREVFAEFQMTGHDKQDAIKIRTSRSIFGFAFSRSIPLSKFLGHKVQAFYGHVDQNTREAIVAAALDDGGSIIAPAKMPGGGHTHEVRV